MKPRHLSSALAMCAIVTLASQAINSSLAEVGPAADSATLIKALQDKDPSVRIQAAGALGSSNRPFPKDAVPALTEALRDEHAGVRKQVLQALSRGGPAAVPALVKTLRDGDRDDRGKAARSLGAIRPVTKEAVLSLGKALQDEDKTVFFYAASSLAMSGPAAKDAVPDILKALRGDNLRLMSVAGKDDLVGEGRSLVIVALVGGDLHVRIFDSKGKKVVDKPEAELDRGYERDFLMKALNEEGVSESHEVSPGVKWKIIESAASISDHPTSRTSNNLVRAISSLGGIGPAAIDALPTLLELVKWGRNGKTGNAAASAIKSIGTAAIPPLIEALQHNDLEVRMAATRVLGTIGPDAREALPALRKVLQDEAFEKLPEEDRNKKLLAWAFAKIGPSLEDLLGLVSGLQDDDPKVRNAAVEQLVKLGPVAIGAAPALLEAVQDEGPEVRRAAAFVLKSIGPSIVPELIKTLEDASPNGQRLIALFLDRTHVGIDYRDPSRVILPLIRALSHKDPDVRSCSANLLSSNRQPVGIFVENNPDGITADLVKALLHHYPEVDIKMVGQFLSEAGEGAVPDLMKALQHEDGKVRYAAADTLGKIGGAAGNAAPALIEALQDEDPKVGEAAGSALSRIRYMPPSCLPSLIELLLHSDPMVSTSVARLLDNQPAGAISKEAIPHLIEALQSKEEMIRRTAVSILGKLGPAAEDAVPSLVRTLEDENRAARERAADALANIGQDSVPALIRASQSEVPETRAAAARALGKVRPTPKDAMPALKELLQDEDADVRRAAGFAFDTINQRALKQQEAEMIAKLAGKWKLTTTGWEFTISEDGKVTGSTDREGSITVENLKERTVKMNGFPDEPTWTVSEDFKLLEGSDHPARRR